MDDVHHFDTGLPNLRVGNVDDLHNNAIGNSFLWNRTDHIDEVLVDLGHKRGQDVLHGATLHLVLWYELHNFDNFLHHLWNTDVNELFNDALLGSPLGTLLDGLALGIAGVHTLKRLR